MRLPRRAAAAVMLAGLGVLPVSAQENQPLFGPDASELTVLGNTDPTVRKATAIVNGDVITDTDVEHRLNLVLAANRSEISEEEKLRLRLQVLRNLIDEKLQIQEASNNEITIPEAEIDQAFARVAQSFRQSPEQFQEYLRAQGSSPESMKQQIHGELAWSRLLRRRVEPFVNVGDDEVEQVIASLEAAKGQEEYRIGEIFLAATPDNEAQVMANAQRIVDQIAGGASFVAYARQFSESSSAAVGGDLGWLRGPQLPQELRPVVSELAEGAISRPVRVPGGVVIVALFDKRRVLAADPSEAVLSVKQISLPFKSGITEAEANELVQQLQSKTRAMGGCGRAEEVAKELGAEVAVSDQLSMRELPRQLQSIMADLQVGQATPPFGSVDEGIRVLVLCGRDDQAQASAPSFDQVYAQLNEARVGMMARRYLRDLRRDAVVDYR
jgi:peptidyl-prolyl cis-trans isomerase SurA